MRKKNNKFYNNNIPVAASLWVLVRLPVNVSYVSLASFRVPSPNDTASLAFLLMYVKCSSSLIPSSNSSFELNKQKQYDMSYEQIKIENSLRSNRNWLVQLTNLRTKINPWSAFSSYSLSNLSWSVINWSTSSCKRSAYKSYSVSLNQFDILSLKKSIRRGTNLLYRIHCIRSKFF